MLGFIFPKKIESTNQVLLDTETLIMPDFISFGNSKEIESTSQVPLDTETVIMPDFIRRK